MRRWIGLLGFGLLALPLGVSAQDTQPDYGNYQLLDVQELDLFAGPARTAAHLAPDGTQFAHFSGDEVCLYVLDGQAWAEDRCFEVVRDVFRGSREDMRWSPDGRYLTAPTYQSALMFFEDTDIQVLDTETGGVLNLTDDGVEGGLLSAEPMGRLDFSPVWLHADTLLFIRYGEYPEADGDTGPSWRYRPAAVYQVTLPADGEADEASEILPFPEATSLLSYLLAADPASGQVAVNLDVRGGDAPFTSTVWQGSMDGQPFEQLASLGSTGIRSLDYSATGEWLMVVQPDFERGTQTGIALISTTTGEVVTPDLDTGDFIEPRLMIAGWSPEGNALAYIVRDPGNPKMSGLYIAPEPGVPGNLVLSGEFYGTTCCQGMSLGWGANNVIMIGRGGQSGVLLVHVGQ